MGVCGLLEPLQGYLAHMKLPPPRTLLKDYAYGPVVVLGGGGGSYERGTPVSLVAPCPLVCTGLA